MFVLEVYSYIDCSTNTNINEFSVFNKVHYSSQQNRNIIYRLREQSECPSNQKQKNMKDM